MKVRRALTAAVLLSFVYAAVRLFWWLDDQQSPASYSATWSGLFKAGIWVLPSAMAAALLARRGAADRWPALGLDAGIARGLAFGLIATLPMAAAVAASGYRTATGDLIVGTVLLGPFAEEVLFRGFLLTHLRRSAGLSLPAAVALSALAFGAAHGPQLNAHVGSYYISSPWELTLVRVGMLAGQIATLTAGGIVFAWVYWRFASLWPAIGLHAFLNFWLTISTDQARTVPGWSLSLVAIAQLLSFVVALWLVRHPGTSRYWRLARLS
ncbi:MAG: CPBP family intramembrane metalloprotease [Acidobacteria bacterium]|nr:CPBP family intramembrane metalloprotease [Acidobacteriota bacterium]